LPSLFGSFNALVATATSQMQWHFGHVFSEKNRLFALRSIESLGPKNLKRRPGVTVQ
jgi:hypothetical protein